MLSDTEISAFMRDGVVKVAAVVPQATVAACVDVIWTELAGIGVLRNEPATWTAPVVRIGCPEGGPFVAAGTAPLLWEAYDQLIVPDVWRKREGVGGTIPVRFPHEADPSDAGWHVEGSYPNEGGAGWRTNVYSRDRGLLSLFLLSDIGPDDAPTRIRPGSHTDAARVLAAGGEQGYDGQTLSPLVDRASAHRPVTQAIGAAGDVYLCHPFLVPAASWPHRGSAPRIIAQPGVALPDQFALTDRAAAYPVEAAIIDALGGVGQAGTPE